MTFSPRAVVSLAGLGMLLSTLDTGIINVALPSLERSFHTSATGITWAVSCYVLALSATIVIFGRLADRVGLVRVFGGGLIAFALGSLLCGLAGSATGLIAARGLQGVGAAMLQATALALVTTLVPPERRGAALGTIGVMIGIGPILGPVVGGLLLSSAGWRWLFWINLPLCAAGLVACARLRGADRVADRSTSYDILGNALLASAVAALLVGLSFWPRQGLGDPATGAWLVGAVALLAAFVVRERMAVDPALDLTWFRSPAFSTALAATFAFGAAAAAVFIVPPFVLQSRLQLAPWQVGLVGMAAPIGLVVASKWSGSQIQARGSRRLMMWGLSLMIGALAGLALTARGEELVVIIGLLLVFGVGGGLFQPANITAVMAAASAAKQGTIAGVQRMVQNVGIAVGATVPAALLTTARGGDAARAFQSAVSTAWAFAGGALLVVLIAFVCAGRTATRGMA